jgi:endonuclease/exonuclease/phosphatase (EEP) superfamily protein YafD
VSKASKFRERRATKLKNKEKKKKSLVDLNVNDARRRRLPSRRVVSTILAGLVCLPTASAAFARWSWMADLLASFRVQTFWLSVAGAAMLLIATRRRAKGSPSTGPPAERSGGWAAAAVLLAAAWNGALIAPCYFPNESPAPAGVAHRILYANVYLFNQNHQRLLDLVATEDPDVIVLVEATPEWVASLGPLRDRYPNRLEAPREDAFGMALYGRLPLKIEKVAVGARGDVALLGAYEEGGHTINVLGVHPPPPVSRSRAKSRNLQLMEAAKFLRERPGESILIGDLNVTPWSPIFGEALEARNLRDSRRGFGVQATWPADRPLLRIPIDHCLVSGRIAIRDRRVGPPIGSDHLPLIVDYAVVSPDK